MPLKSPFIDAERRFNVFERRFNVVERTFKDAERRIHQASNHYLIGTRTIN